MWRLWTCDLESRSRGATVLGGTSHGRIGTGSDGLAICPRGDRIPSVGHPQWCGSWRGLHAEHRSWRGLGTMLGRGAREGGGVLNSEDRRTNGGT